MSHIIKEYRYNDESGVLLFQEVKYFPKKFRQRRPDPENPGQWIWNLDGVRLVPYHLQALLKERQLVCLNEGPKDVETAEKLGFVATTVPMGACKWHLGDYAQYFKGVDTLVIFEDNDEAGRKDVIQKATALHGIVKHIKVISFRDKPEHFDLSDWYHSYKSKIALSHKLTTMIHDAPEWTPPPEAEASKDTKEANKGKTILTVNDFLLHFGGVKETNAGYQCQCPAHDDKHASLSVAEKSGKILLKCHAGCDTKTIIETVGLSLADLFLESNRIKAGKGDYQFTKFWYEVVINEGKENERIELKIDYRLFLQFLEKNGFGLLIQDHEVEIVQVRDNIVSHTTFKRTVNVTAKQFTLSYLRKLGQYDVENLMLQRHGTFFVEAFLTSLRPIEKEFYRDTKEVCSFFFSNGFVEIRKTGDNVTSSFKPYSKLERLVWETQIQEKAYLGTRTATPVNPDYDGESEFGDFVTQISTKVTQLNDTDKEIASNYTPFLYGYGYLLHNYKDVANAKAILAVDDNPSSNTNANGGRGKSLFCKAFEEFRKATYEDGRQIKTDNNQFMMQSVENDSQILWIDDVKKGFDFTLFYPFITGDANQEIKHERRRRISFHETPKLLLTSNYAIGGIGDSDVRRWYILPFVSHFSASHTPADQFGHRLFDDWDEKEWNNFFDWTIDTIEKYFRFTKPPEVNLTDYHESKLTSLLPEELFDFFECRFCKVANGLPYEYPKKLFYEDFIAENPVYGPEGRKWTQRYFSERLNIYCKMRNYEINPDRPNGRYQKNHQGESVDYIMICQKKA